MIYERESELEAHLRRILLYHLQPSQGLYVLSSKKVADIVICREHPAPAAFFIEAKLYTTKRIALVLEADWAGDFSPNFFTSSRGSSRELSVG